MQAGWKDARAAASRLFAVASPQMQLLKVLSTRVDMVRQGYPLARPEEGGYTKALVKNKALLNKALLEMYPTGTSL